MKQGLGDWAWACIAGVLLLGVASAIVFVMHPGGVRGQVGWYAGLLPGSIVAAILGGLVQDSLPHAQRIVYLSFSLLFSFVWYFLIAYIVIKIARAASGAGRNAKAGMD